MDLILVGQGRRDTAEAAALLREAMSVAPASCEDAPADLLPRRKLTGRCRLCGKLRPLTREHIPPKGAGNMATMPTRTVDKWLARDPNASIPRTGVVQGGIWGYTLCKDCNSFTGQEYGAEYQSWAVRAVLLLRQSPNLHPSVLDQNPEPVVVEGRFGGRRDGGVAPGAMVRQVLSCMCSLSDSWDLAGNSPEIRSMVLDQSALPLPTGMSLWMEFFAGPHSRMSGPQVVSDGPGRWAWLMELAHPPFVFTMVLNSNYQPAYGMDMGPFAIEDPSRRVTLDAEWKIAFGWTPIPGDFRSTAAIERDNNSRQPWTELD